MDQKSLLPWTDSGYASMSRPNPGQHVERPERLNLPRGAARVLHDNTNVDSKTAYSKSDSLETSLERQFIFGACQSIRNGLGFNLNPEDWTCLSRRLPELLKAFAVKIGLESSDQENFKVMWFFHRCGR